MRLRRALRGGFIIELLYELLNLLFSHNFILAHYRMSSMFKGFYRRQPGPG